MTREVWMPVVGYEGFYEVSNLGRVRRSICSARIGGTSAGKILNPWMRRGYPVVKLSVHGKVKTFFVHRLVLFAFRGPPGEGQVSCHNDGDGGNGRLSNLRWGTEKENRADSIKHGTHPTGENHAGAKLTDEAVRLIRLRPNKSERQLAKEFGVSPGTISSCKRMKSWKHVQ